MVTRGGLASGSFWHQCSPLRQLLDVADPAVTQGRYHRIGGAGAWYASSSETAAWAEVFRHHQGVVSVYEVLRRIGKVRVDNLRVLDLTVPEIRETINASYAELVSDELTRCQSIANDALAAGYDGIFAPSAALAGHQTLVVFSSAMSRVSQMNERVRHAPARMSRVSRRIPRIPTRSM